MPLDDLTSISTVIVVDDNLTVRAVFRPEESSVPIWEDSTGWPARGAMTLSVEDMAATKSDEDLAAYVKPRLALHLYEDAEKVVNELRDRLAETHEHMSQMAKYVEAR